MLKVGVIGVGQMGANHVRVLREIPEVEVVGIADSSQKTGELISTRHRVPYYADYRTLLDEAAPQAIVVAVPTTLHKEVCLSAFSKGIHALVEKPISFTVEEGRDMIKAAQKSRVLFGVGHIERFNPAIIELKRRIDAGELGKIFMIHSRRQSPLPKRIVDVGVGMDLATHELDMMHFITDSEVAHLSAEVSQINQGRVREDMIFSLLRFHSGVLGVLDVNWVTPTTVRDITVTGEKGMFVVNYHTQDLCFYENPAASSYYNITAWGAERDFSVEAGNMTRFHVPKREPLRNELEAFVSAVLSGAETAPVPGEAGLKALEIALQIVASGNATRVVAPSRT